MITKVKLVIIAVLVTALTSCVLIMNKMDEQLERRKERITFLEQMVQEQYASFKKLQESCFISQKISEQNAEMTQGQLSEADLLKEEISKLQETVESMEYRGLHVPNTGDNTSGDGMVAQQQFGGKQGEKHPSNAGLNARLDDGLIRLLDKAYCEASRDSVYCSPK
jgi:hypothetical protein